MAARPHVMRVCYGTDEAGENPCFPALCLRADGPFPLTPGMGDGSVEARSRRPRAGKIVEPFLR